MMSRISSLVVSVAVVKSLLPPQDPSFVAPRRRLEEADEYLLSAGGGSCEDACTAQDMVCSQEGRLAVDSFDVMKGLMEDYELGKCLYCSNGCMDGSKSGPTLSLWSGDTYYCSHNTGGEGGRCDQKGSSNSIQFCACNLDAPPAPKEPVNFEKLMLLFFQFPSVKQEVCAKVPAGSRRRLSVNLDDAEEFLSEYPLLRAYACNDKTVDPSEVVVWDKCCGTYNKFKTMVSNLRTENNDDVCKNLGSNVLVDKKNGKVVGCKAKGKNKVECKNFSYESICKATHCQWNSSSNRCEGDIFEN